MTIWVFYQVFCIALFAVCGVEGFVVSLRPPSSSVTRSLLAPDSTHARTTAAARTMVGPFDVRDPLTPAPSMSSYEEGSTCSGGGEPRMELQELIVDFTDDGRILLEVKGVKVCHV